MRQFNVRRLVAKLKSLLRLRNLILLVAVVIFYNSIAFRRGFDGQVVDLVTHQPIEGAVVLAHWRLKYYWIEAQDGGALQLIEVVTDKDGKFHIPGWIKMYSPLRGDMSEYEDPELLIFKLGYRFKQAMNFPPSVERLGGPNPPTVDEEIGIEQLRPAEWDRHKFMLRPLSTTSERMQSAKDAFEYIYAHVYSYRESKRCMWARAAKMFLAISAAYREADGDSNAMMIETYKPEIDRCGQGHAFGWK